MIQSDTVTPPRRRALSHDLPLGKGRAARRRADLAHTTHRQQPRRYVPEGLSAAEWNQRQANEKRGKVENKKKYPKGAPQVVGVGKYLENLARKQTFKKNSVGNAKVEASGHAFAKVKFGEFTKEGYDAWRKKGGKPPNMEGRSANLWR